MSSSKNLILFFVAMVIWALIFGFVLRPYFFPDTEKKPDTVEEDVQRYLRSEKRKEQCNGYVRFVVEQLFGLV